MRRQRMNRWRQKARRKEKGTKEKVSTHGAKEEDQKKDASTVVETTTQGSARRTKKVERVVRKEERQKEEKEIGILNRGSGPIGIQDSGPPSGKTCALEIPKDGERASQKELTEWNMGAMRFHQYWVQSHMKKVMVTSIKKKNNGGQMSKKNGQTKP